IEISGSITGTGTLGITNQTTMILDGPVGSGQTIQFQISSGAIGTLLLNHPNEFSGTIQGFSNITRIDLPNIKFSPTVSATVVKYDQVANITTVAITDGNNTDTLKLVGDYRPPAHTFNFSSDGPNNGTIVVDPPASTTTTDALTTTTDTSTTTTDASIATDAATTITDATVTPIAQASPLTATKTTSRQTKATSATVTETPSSRTNATLAAAAADEGIMVALNTAVAVAVALDTAVADPDSGKTSSLTISGNDTAVDITGTVPGSDSSTANSGAALGFSPISHRMAETLTDNGTVEVINGKPADAVSETGAFKIDA